MLKGNYIWEVVEIVIGGVPNVLEIRFMCLFMSLGGILLHRLCIDKSVKPDQTSTGSSES
jgi:hypothetical protein